MGIVNYSRGSEPEVRRLQLKGFGFDLFKEQRQVGKNSWIRWEKSLWITLTGIA